MEIQSQIYDNISDGLMQKRSNCSTSATELHLFYM